AGARARRPVPMRYRRRAQDLAIERARRLLGLDAELALEPADADLVLPQRRRPPALAPQQLHHRPMHVLAQRVEREEPRRGVECGFGSAVRDAPLEELRQDLDREPVQALALDGAPLLEGLLVDAQPVEELALVAGGRALERPRIATGGGRFELAHVDADRRRIERDGVGADQQHAISAATERAAEARQRLAEALPRALLRRLAPKQRGELLPSVEPPRRHREIGEQRLRLAGRQHARLRPLGLDRESAEQFEVDQRHAVVGDGSFAVANSGSFPPTPPLFTLFSRPGAALRRGKMANNAKAMQSAEELAAESSGRSVRASGS